MKHIPREEVVRVYEDRLVFRLVLKDGRTISQGKRVGKDCPLGPEDRRLYVKESAAAVVAKLHKEGLSLLDAMRLVNRARFWGEGRPKLWRVTH